MAFANPVITTDRLIVVGVTPPTTFTLLFNDIPRDTIANAESTINSFLSLRVTDRGVLCRVKALPPLPQAPTLSLMAYASGNPRSINLNGWTG